jgi:hypothetical protein
MFLFAVIAASLAACGGAATGPPTSVEPVFDGLGTHRRTVDTSSPDAQRFFDQGLAFLYAFNHDEAIRHALGATLLMERRYADAESVYREDLARLPGNGWSLYGLGRALRLQGKDDEATQVEASFTKAWAGADTTLRSSCFCQPGV